MEDTCEKVCDFDILLLLWPQDKQFLHFQAVSEVLDADFVDGTVDGFPGDPCLAHVHKHVQFPQCIVILNKNKHKYVNNFYKYINRVLLSSGFAKHMRCLIT